LPLRGGGGQTFGAALEQFEELLLAAARVPPATAPILLFYALSQAGRALVAAYGGEQWEVHGHGLSIATRRDPIGETTISAKGDGLFQAVAQATHSDPLTDGMTLAQLWGRIPGLDRGPGLGAEEPTIFMVDHQPTNTQSRVARDERGRLLPKGDAFTADSETYPPLAEARIDYSEQGDRTIVSLEFETSAAAATFDGHLWRYLGATYLRAGGGPGKEPSGLMLWWMLLQALSQLARYEPAGWTRALNPDLSPLAVPLERTLRRAGGLVPLLVLEALTSWG
jgi:hypothetical protein